MKRETLVGAVMTLALMSLASADLLAKGYSRTNPCDQTARRIFAACNFDVRDNQQVAQAKCENISDKQERTGCHKTALQLRKEESELCREQFGARRDACDLLGEYRYDPDPLLDPGISYVEPDEIHPGNANPYLSLVAGHTFVVRAGEEGEEIGVVHVTDRTREIEGVSCRVVVDAVVTLKEDEEGGDPEIVPVEVTDDWFAQDVAGNVYYCGELSRNYDEGLLVDLDGSFEAGRDFAKGGLLIMAMPKVGLAHRQEFALGEAEDIISYEQLSASPFSGENGAFPCAGNCLQTFDHTPLDPKSTEFKYYLPGVGFVLVEAMEDGSFTGEREELVCVGTSLEILGQDDCGIEDADALLDKLCELSPAAFCRDD